MRALTLWLVGPALGDRRAATVPETWLVVSTVSSSSLSATSVQPQRYHFLDAGIEQGGGSNCPPSRSVLPPPRSCQRQRSVGVRLQVRCQMSAYAGVTRVQAEPRKQLSSILQPPWGCI